MPITDNAKRACMNVISVLSGLTPIERVAVMGFVAGCYCKNCGYPAPPDGEFCCAFSDRAEPVSNGEHS